MENPVNLFTSISGNPRMGQVKQNASAKALKATKKGLSIRSNSELNIRDKSKHSGVGDKNDQKLKLQIPNVPGKQQKDKSPVSKSPHEKSLLKPAEVFIKPKTPKIGFKYPEPENLVMIYDEELALNYPDERLLEKLLVNDTPEKLIDCPEPPKEITVTRKLDLLTPFAIYHDENEPVFETLDLPIPDAAFE